MHHTESLFPDHEVFRPERFLDATTGRFRNDERVIYFGSGKRRCAGEVLGRAETYLFAVSLVQAFRWSVPSGVRKPDLLKYKLGINMYPLPFEAAIEPRY